MNRGWRQEWEGPLEGCLLARGHHLGRNNVWVEQVYTGLLECLPNQLWSKSSDVCFAIDLQECLLCDLTTILLPLYFLFHPVPLQNTEYNNIEALICVGGVCRITKDMDLVGTSIIKELERVVRVVAIDN